MYLLADREALLLDCATMADTVAPIMLTPMPDMPDPDSPFATSDTAATTALMLGVAPGQAVATSYQGLAHSLSLLMLGDTQAHQAFASTSTAIVTATVKMLLGVEAGNG